MTDRRKIGFRGLLALPAFVLVACSAGTGASPTNGLASTAPSPSSGSSAPGRAATA
mgnify:CR=1 FL=1